MSEPITLLRDYRDFLKLPLAERLFILAIAMMPISQCVLIAFQLPYFNFFPVISYLSGAFLILFVKGKKAHPVAWCMCIYFTVTIAYGFIRGNPMNFWGSDVGYFAPIIFVLLGNKHELTLWGFKSLGYSASFLALFIVPLVIFRFEPSQFDVRFSAVDLSYGYMNIMTIGACMLLIHQIYPKTIQLALFACASVLFIGGIALASRGLILIPVIIAVIKFAITLQDDIKRFFVLFIVSSLFLGGALFAYAQVWGGHTVMNAFDFVKARTTETDLLEGRTVEIDMLSMTWSNTDLAIGQGMGAYNLSLPIAPRLIHLGHGHIIMRGGWIWVSIIALGMLLALYKGVFYRTPIAWGVVGILLVFIPMNIAHTQFYGSSSVAMFGLALAYCINLRKGKWRKPKKRIAK